jgi:hypothetical protein
MDIMKTLTSLFAAFAFTAISTGAVVAGQPDNPGGLGETFNEAKDSLQAATGDKNAWGQAIKENNAAGNPSLGQIGHAIKGAVGASPNPDNDNGKGND